MYAGFCFEGIFQILVAVVEQLPLKSLELKATKLSYEVSYAICQVIQFMTFSSPIVAGHDSPLSLGHVFKFSTHHPKKVTIAELPGVFLFADLFCLRGSLRNPKNPMIPFKSLTATSRLVVESDACIGKAKSGNSGMSQHKSSE